jgi:F0F1-type ATP synthase membrane subunit b/b'
VPKFVGRMGGRTPPEGRVDEAGTGRAAHARADTRSAGHRTRDGEEPEDSTLGATPLAVDENAGGLITDYGKLGEHVTAVLEAARTAAEKMKDEARDEARRLVVRTRKEATETVDAARNEAARVSAETAQLRADAEKETRETRHLADAYVAEKRGEADAEASAIVTRAKREATEQLQAAQKRQGALDTNVALTEERLSQLVGGLRDLAVRLEELLREERPVLQTVAVDDAPASESLEESLRPSATTHSRSAEDGE